MEAGRFSRIVVIQLPRRPVSILMTKQVSNIFFYTLYDVLYIETLLNTFYIYLDLCKTCPDKMTFAWRLVLLTHSTKFH